MARSDDADARAARWERDAHDLATQVAYLQEELALVRRREEDAAEVVRDGRGEAVGEIARVQEHDLRAAARLPVEQARRAQVNAFGDAGYKPGGLAILLGEMDFEVLGLQRAPA